MWRRITSFPHFQPTFLHIIIPSGHLTVSVHQIGSLICNQHDKLMVKMTILLLLCRVDSTSLALRGLPWVTGWYTHWVCYPVCQHPIPETHTRHHANHANHACTKQDMRSTIIPCIKQRGICLHGRLLAFFVMTCLAKTRQARSAPTRGMSSNSNGDSANWIYQIPLLTAHLLSWDIHIYLSWSASIPWWFLHSCNGSNYTYQKSSKQQAHQWCRYVTACTE